MGVIENDRTEAARAAYDEGQYGPLGGWRDLASRNSWARQHPVWLCLCVVCTTFRIGWKHPGPCVACNAELHRRSWQSIHGVEQIETYATPADGSVYCPATPGRYHEHTPISPDDFTFLLTEVARHASTGVSSIPQEDG